MSIMPWGLLWYEADGALEDRVAHAAERYVEKYGSKPNTCIVHPELLGGEKVDVPGYNIIPHHTVLKNHLWIGERKG